MIQPLNEWMEDTGMPYISREPPAQDGFGSLLGRRLIYVLWLPFMPAASTAVHGPPRTHKTCQKGKAPLPCCDVSGAASGAFHSVGCLRTAVFLLLYLDSELGHFGFVLNDVVLPEFYHRFNKRYIL